VYKRKGYWYLRKKKVQNFLNENFPLYDNVEDIQKTFKYVSTYEKRKKLREVLSERMKDYEKYNEKKKRIKDVNETLLQTLNREDKSEESSKDNN